MAPTAVQVVASQPEIVDLKAKLVDDQVEVVKESPKVALADDFMYDFKYNQTLPTLDVLGVQIAEDVDARKEADALLTRLSEILGQGDAHGFADLFIENGG